MREAENCHSSAEFELMSIDKIINGKVRDNGRQNQSDLERKMEGTAAEITEIYLQPFLSLPLAFD